MMSGKGVDHLPSYEESISARQAQPATISDSRTRARTALVTSLLETHVMKHLDGIAMIGLSSTTLVLVPANVSILQPAPNTSTKPSTTFPGEKIVSFASSENPSILRMQRPELSFEFCRQPAVIQEIHQQLCAHLERDGHRMVKTKRGEGQAVTTDWKAAEGCSLVDGEASITVAIEEVCLRIETDMGLYETRSGKALVIKTEIGG